MKRSLKALAWAAACWLMPVQAQAQYVETSAYRPTTQPVSYFNTSGCGEAACGTAGCDPSCGTGEAGCGVANGCGNGCGNGCNSCNGCGRRGLFGCCDGDPWTVKDSPGFNWGGWVQVGWQDRADGAFTNNGVGGAGIGFSQKEHGNVNLNQLYTFVEKVADGACGLDWGFRFDSMFGVDGNEGQSFGNVRGGFWDYLNGFGGPTVPFTLTPEPAPHGPYELAFPQAYAQLALGKFSTKFGHFYTPIGYEVVTSPANFFLSRQMTFYNSEPFTHTGFYTTYTKSDTFNTSFGIVAGMDTGFRSYNDGAALLSGFTWVVNDRITINNYGMGGKLGWRGDGFINSAILSIAWTERFSTVHQFDLFETNGAVDAGGFPSGVNAPVARMDFQANGFAGDSIGWINYAFFQVGPCTKLGSRIEWYKADGDSYYTFTNGVNFKLSPNMMIRPEVRLMWSNDNAAASIPGANLFQAGGRTVLGCDWIYTF